MALTPEETEKIVAFVRQEPRTVLDVARLLGRSWLTADSHVRQVAERTGLVSVKVFRQGSPGALKLVYYNHAESLAGDDVRQELYLQIKAGRRKQDFDFFEVFQFVPDSGKRAFAEEFTDEGSASKLPLAPFLLRAEHTLTCFSGNMSFLPRKEGKKSVAEVFGELLGRGVRIRVLCRLNVATLANIGRISHLLKKYPELIEIRHCYQPLRGYIIDDSAARFKSEETLQQYRPGELRKNTRVFYEVTDAAWVGWLQRVFWNLYRSSIDYRSREEQLAHLFSPASRGEKH